jgi:hypothetical protein|tara:strand:- start:9 stop:212 length:204 start_codon:yes stop_codon:yes gene_type:complete
MEAQRLTPFQENELQWLKKQVDRLQDDEHKRSVDSNLQTLNLKRDLWMAREELSKFVKNLRKSGKKI